MFSLSLALRSLMTCSGVGFVEFILFGVCLASWIYRGICVSPSFFPLLGWHECHVFPYHPTGPWDLIFGLVHFSLWCSDWRFLLPSLPVHQFSPLPFLSCGGAIQWIFKKLWLWHFSVINSPLVSSHLLFLCWGFYFFIYFKCVHNSLLKHTCGGCFKILVR